LDNVAGPGTPRYAAAQQCRIRAGAVGQSPHTRDFYRPTTDGIGRYFAMNENLEVDLDGSSRARRTAQWLRSFKWSPRAGVGHSLPPIKVHHWAQDTPRSAALRARALFNRQQGVHHHAGACRLWKPRAKPRQGFEIRGVVGVSCSDMCTCDTFQLQSHHDDDHHASLWNDDRGKYNGGFTLRKQNTPVVHARCSVSLAFGAVWIGDLGCFALLLADMQRPTVPRESSPCIRRHSSTPRSRLL
jgi:hypothetical protein